MKKKALGLQNALSVCCAVYYRFTALPVSLHLPELQLPFFPDNIRASTGCTPVSFITHVHYRAYDPARTFFWGLRHRTLVAILMLFLFIPALPPLAAAASHTRTYRCRQLVPDFSSAPLSRYHLFVVIVVDGCRRTL